MDTIDTLHRQVADLGADLEAHKATLTAERAAHAAAAERGRSDANAAAHAATQLADLTSDLLAHKELLEVVKSELASEKRAHASSAAHYASIADARVTIAETERDLAISAAEARVVDAGETAEALISAETEAARQWYADKLGAAIKQAGART